MLENTRKRELLAGVDVKKLHSDLLRFVAGKARGNITTADVQDVVQTALLKIVEALQRNAVGDMQKIDAYSRSVAFRCFLDLLRQRKIRLCEDGVVESLPDSSLDSEGLLLTAEAQQVLRTAIDQLPNELKEPLRLDLADCTDEEISRRVGISQAAVKSRLRSARKVLVKNFTENSGQNGLV